MQLRREQVNARLRRSFQFSATRAAGGTAKQSQAGEPRRHCRREQVIRGSGDGSGNAIQSLGVGTRQIHQMHFRL